MTLPLSSPIARRKDPATSHAAGRAISESGKREGQVLAVLALVRKYPGRTSLELSKLSFGLDRYTVSRRLPEVEKRGLIRRGETRECSVNGREMLTWWPAASPVSRQEVFQF